MKVIPSFQLALGVDGYKPEVLLNLLENIKKVKKPLLPPDRHASCCHGITSALSFRRNDSSFDSKLPSLL
jgi:hypothetical protein